MAGSSDYPDAVDTYPHVDQPPDDLSGPHVLDHAAGIKAIQEELGTNPAGDAPTVRERMETVESGRYFAAVTPNDSGAAAANKTAIDNAITAAAAGGGGTVWIICPTASAGLVYVYTDGGHTVPGGVKLDTPGWAMVLVHRGSSFCVRMLDEEALQSAPAIGQLRIAGSLSGVAAVSGAVGFEFGNGYNFEVDRLWVDGFTDAGANVKFHNTDGDLGWTGGHQIGQLVSLNGAKCVQFIADADTDDVFGEIHIDKAMILPSANQVGFSFGRSNFYNSRISGALNIGGNNAIGIDIATTDARVSASGFDLSGEMGGAFTGCKRIKFSAAGTFDAFGRIFINGQPPDDIASVLVYNFVEEEHTFGEAGQTHNRTIASAGTITIPGGARVFNVTGTTTISTISASTEGRVVTLKFASALTVENSGNIDMSTPFVAAAGDTLTLAYLGATWYRVAADANKVLVGAASAPAGLGAAFTSKARSAGTEAAVFLRNAAGSTANIMYVGDENGNFLSGFNKGGYFIIRKLTAPADADLTANDLAFWFDPTNGAAKVKFKAKQADGTVRTGEVALT